MALALWGAVDFAMVTPTPKADRDPETCRIALERLLDRSRLELLVCDSDLRVQLASRGAGRALAGGELAPGLAEAVRAQLDSTEPRPAVRLDDGRALHVAEVERAGPRIFVWLHEPLLRRGAESTVEDRYRLGVRGRQLLKLLREGLTNREIGTRLGLREATVKTYLHEVYQALGVKSRTAALAVIERDSTYFR